MDVNPPSSEIGQPPHTGRTTDDRQVLAHYLASGILLLATMLVVGVTVLRVWVVWRHHSHLTFVSGVWISLATDLRDGVFYRALVGPDGYGGTRFFPLHVVLHAALMKLGAAPLSSGYVLSAAAAAALMIGVYR